MIKYYLLIIIGVLVSSVSQIILKTAAKKKRSSIFREYLNFSVIAGYGLMFVSLVMVMLSYVGLPYKYGPVIESLGYVFVLVLSIFILKEKLTLSKIIGNALIIVGVIVYHL